MSVRMRAPFPKIKKKTLFSNAFLREVWAMGTLIMTSAQARELLLQLRRVFDIARFVDPVRNRIIELDGEDGRLRISDAICHAVWNRGQRCQNCVSSKALTSGGRALKLEYLDGDPYIVVAQYAEVDDYPCVLETVVQAGDDIILSGSPDTQAFLQRIRLHNENVWKDPLTCAKSRGYYDEQLCVLRAGAIAAVEVEGYAALEERDPQDAHQAIATVAEAVVRNCRPDDILVRYTGGTFLLCAHNLSDEECLKDLMRRLQRRVKEALEGAMGGNAPSVAIAGCYGPGLAEDLVPEALNALKQSESNIDLMIAVAFVEPPPLPFPGGGQDK